jgi:hypothetical protein
MNTCAKHILSLRPSPLGMNMGWYLGEFPLPPVIPILAFLFHFFEKMDTCRGVHWGFGYLEGEGFYDPAHPWREVSLLEPQRPWGTFPRLVAG